jgi:hypothetical protein
MQENLCSSHKLNLSVTVHFLYVSPGTSKLEEWFPLEGELNGTERGRPRIRVISPNNLAREEGKRKRRRTSTGQRTWRLRERVDAFVQDG